MGAVRAERSAVTRLGFLLLLLLGFSVSGSAAWDLVLLHTNDVHARVEETDKFSGKCGGGGGGCFGGVARRATMINRIRRAERNVLLLDAGDQFQGTVWFYHYRGAEAAHFMDKLRYDAMVRPAGPEVQPEPRTRGPKHLHSLVLTDVVEITTKPSLNLV